METEKIHKNQKIEITSILAIILILLQSILPQEVIVILMFVALMILYGIRERIYINTVFVSICILFFIHGISNIILGNNMVKLLLFQMIGIVLSYIFYYNFLYKDNVIKVIQVYINCVKWLSLFVLIQQVAYISGITFLYDLSWLVPGQQVGVVGEFYRSVTIFAEPSIIATFFSPAIYFSISSFFDKKNRCMSLASATVILLGTIFSFSTLAYVGIAVSLGVFVIKNGKTGLKIFIIVMLCVICTLVYNKVEFVKDRVDGVIDLLLEKDVEQVNLSSETLVANIKVMINSTCENVGLGTGAGSYQIQYDKYKEAVFKDRVSMAYDLNREDGNSLFIRIVVEFGILGILLFCFFIYRFFVKEKNIYGSISCAILVLILLRLIRCGHYFQGETFFFIVLYVLNYYQHRKDYDALALYR